MSLARCFSCLLKLTQCCEETEPDGPASDADNVVDAVVDVEGFL